MGLDRVKKSPCGFCFVEYKTHADMLMAITCLDGTALDERIIKVGVDPGFKQGRQFGRGMSGGQVRDEARATNDPARGGMGGLALAEMAYGPLQGVDDWNRGRGDWHGGGGGGGNSYKRPRVDWDARNSRR
ncbi:unnamed protein product [Sphacelaria rigidula]